MPVLFKTVSSKYLLSTSLHCCVDLSICIGIHRAHISIHRTHIRVYGLILSASGDRKLLSRQAQRQHVENLVTPICVHKSMHANAFMGFMHRGACNYNCCRTVHTSSMPTHGKPRGCTMQFTLQPSLYTLGPTAVQLVVVGCRIKSSLAMIAAKHRQGNRAHAAEAIQIPCLDGTG